MGFQRELAKYCHRNFEIANVMDMRPKLEERPDLIWNFSQDEGRNKIRLDRESFILKNGKVEISMEGVFAEDIEKLVSSIITEN